MRLDNNNHSVFLLCYRLILVVKQRCPVIDQALSEYAKDMFYRLSGNYNIVLESWQAEADHLQIVFRAHPNTELSKFINAYKSASSRQIKKFFPEIKPVLSQNTLWSKSFCLLTEGSPASDVINEYLCHLGTKK